MVRDEIDREILERYLPGNLTTDEPGHGRRVVGVMALRLGEAPIEQIEVELRFGPAYPVVEPDVFDVAKRFAHDPDRHFMGDRCCLWFDLESEWNAGDDKSLEAFMQQVAVFFTRQLIVDAGFGWLGGQRPHGRIAADATIVAERVGLPLRQLATFGQALRGMFREDRACPCGSGTSYWLCHREEILRATANVPRRRLVDLADVLDGLRRNELAIATVTFELEAMSRLPVAACLRRELVRDHPSR